MAEIHLARQRGIEGLERTVVVKRILEKHAQNDEFVTMFLDEARLLAALSHPNIAQVFDLGRAGDAHYLVMEYVRGPTLGAMLQAAVRRGRPGLPLPVALAIALAIGEALDYVHERRDEYGRPLGIVHRDLNPANVMVSWDGAVKIIDFGIAKAATKVYETRTGVIKGTYGYIAPEVLTSAGRVDRRADVYALGILLYEMVVGAHPYDTSDEPNLVDRILEARYRRPRDVAPHVPRELDALIARCLAPLPDGRPESMREMVDAIAYEMVREGVVPTQGLVAAAARDLVPDEEGPIPLKRPTAVRPSRAPRADGTRPVRGAGVGAGSSRPPPEGTRRVRVPETTPTVRPPIGRDGTTNDETAPVAPREDDTVPRSVASIEEEDHQTHPTRREDLPPLPPPPPPPSALPPLDDVAPPVRQDMTAPTTVHRRPASDPPALGSTRSSGEGASTALRADPPSHRGAEPARVIDAVRSSESGRTPTAPSNRRVRNDTTLRLRKSGGSWTTALAALGLVAAGTLAFFAARTMGGQTSSEHGDDRSALHVITEPPGATVTIDGVVSGARTPAVVSIGNGVPAIELRLELAGYEPEVRVVPRGTPEIELVLRPLAGQPPEPEAEAEAPAERRRR